MNKKLLLTIWYFIVQKIVEIGKVIGTVLFYLVICLVGIYVMLLILGIIPYLLSFILHFNWHWMGIDDSFKIGNATLNLYLDAIPFSGIFYFAALLTLFAIGLLIVDKIVPWIVDNWEMAKEKAENRGKNNCKNT